MGFLWESLALLVNYRSFNGVDVMCSDRLLEGARAQGALTVFHCLLHLRWDCIGLL